MNTSIGEGLMDPSNWAERTYWYAPDLSIKDEPLMKSLLQYRLDEDRWEVFHPEDGNLISSRTHSGQHMPIIDMDFPHHFVKSTTEGHTHLFIDVEMSRFKLFVLVTALAYAGVIEKEHAIWTIRRGASFVRRPGIPKLESPKPTFGWFRKKK